MYHKLQQHCKSTQNSQSPLIRKAIVPLRAHDDMVQYLDVKIPRSMPDFDGQFFICSRGSEVAGRVVVAKDDADCIFLQGFFEDDPGICNRAGHSARTDDFEMPDPVGPVQKKHGKYLVRKIHQFCLEVFCHRSATRDNCRFEVFSAHASPSQLHCRLDGNRFDHADSLGFHQLPGRHPCQIGQPVAAPVYQFLCQLHGGFFFCAILDQDCQQFSLCQLPCSFAPQLLSWLVFTRPMFDLFHLFIFYHFPQSSNISLSCSKGYHHFVIFALQFYICNVLVHLVRFLVSLSRYSTMPSGKKSFALLGVSSFLFIKDLSHSQCIVIPLTK